MNRRSGLGKGLSSLIPTEAAETSSAYREVEVHRVVPNRLQPRSHFDEETLDALTASIREVGVIQPIVVRESDDGYELIAGERRWRAANRAGLATIPALVRPADDQASLETAIVENLHRQDLNPLEEAAAYLQLVDDFGLTQEEVATRVGRSRSAVANTIRLLQLSPHVQRLVLEDQISAGHARALLGLPTVGEQEALADRVVEERLTVRQTEELVRGDEPAEEEEPATPAPPEPVGVAGGDDDELVPRAPGAVVEPGVLELEELLAARLDTRVQVKLGRGPGRIVVQFADLDDLERIYRIITPPGTIV